MTAATVFLSVMIASLTMGHFFLYLTKDRVKSGITVSAQRFEAPVKEVGESAEDKVVKLDARNRVLQEKIKLAHQRLDDYTWELEKTKRMRIKGHRFLPKLKEMEKKLTETQINIQTEIDSIKKITEEMHSKNSDFVNIAHFNKEIARLNDEIAEAQNRALDVKASITEINSLKSSLENAGIVKPQVFKKEVDDLQAKIEELHKKVAMPNEELQAKIEELHKKVAMPDNNLKTFKDQLENFALSQKAFVASDEYKKDLEKTTNEIERAIKLIQSIEEFKNNAAGIQNEFKAMKEYVNNLQLNAKALVSADKYNEEVRKLKDEVSGIKEIAKEVVALKRISGKLKDIDEFREVAGKDLETLKVSVEGLHKKTEDVVNIAEHRTELNKITRELINLKEQTHKIGKLDNFRSSTEAELEGIKEVIEEMQRQTTSSDMSDKYKSELLKVNKEINDLEKNLHKLIYRSKSR